MAELRGFNVKTIETPTTIEIYEYLDSPVVYSVAEPGEASKEEDEEAVKREESASDHYDAMRRREQHYLQTRWDIARIIDCNFDAKTKFVTLTFRENIQDVSFCNVEFGNFIKRLNYRLYKQKKNLLKYLAVWERQKRGAVHYHVVFFDLPYIKKSVLEETWSNGFIKINRVAVDSRENVGRYISKYFTKNVEEKTYKQKAFWKSQNLKVPKVTRRMFFEDLDFSNDDVVFSKEYARRVPDFSKRGNMGAAFKDGKVRYTKIRKEPNNGDDDNEK